MARCWTTLRYAAPTVGSAGAIRVIAAALPELGSKKWQEMLPGAINRIQALRGVAKGPGGLGDVYMLQSTDGMCYLLTRDDGLFIGTVFKPFAFAPGWDTIPQAKRHEPRGLFAPRRMFQRRLSQAQASGQGFTKGHYYLTGLARSAICELTGLDSVNRLAGGNVTLVEGAGLYSKATPTPAVPLELPPAPCKLLRRPAGRSRRRAGRSFSKASTSPMPTFSQRGTSAACT